MFHGEALAATNIELIKAEGIICLCKFVGRILNQILYIFCDLIHALCSPWHEVMHFKISEAKAQDIYEQVVLREIQIHFDIRDQYDS